MNVRLTVSLWVLSAMGVVLLGNVGCQKEQSPVAEEAAVEETATVAIIEGETPSDEQKEAMLAAKDALFQTLSGRLTEAMGNQGPAGAIEVCQKEAPQMAADVSESHALKIGRTGVRLRNPNNQPPAWAKAMTEAKVDTPQFVSLTNGNSAALLPIKLKAECLMCHGPKDQMPPMISSQLAKLYPNDHATDFKEGELRGWFWVEKPAS
ncbi:hypothetical protein FF011L_25830 [Roseimaritima multifibrata]|uniref:Tll0287-like domain-containing protein n=1 Tax=Roseimaritima multifibrata TaxID=1930274 RepID=A0A517MG01_9BACT|nr:DUF3365 domain-containing protein [Roseimaritima multifibrata]QDS93810.1 hypothetical protein FF011L_25830 [Roseimaritima multifibrata]